MKQEGNAAASYNMAHDFKAESQEALGRGKRRPSRCRARGQAPPPVHARRRRRSSAPPPLPEPLPPKPRRLFAGVHGRALGHDEALVRRRCNTRRCAG